MPRIRDEIFPALQKLRVVPLPVQNLPEKTSRWGESLTEEKRCQNRHAPGRFLPPCPSGTESEFTGKPMPKRDAEFIFF